MTAFATQQAKSAPIPGLEQGTPSLPTRPGPPAAPGAATTQGRSEEHTSELQSH